MSHGRLSWTTFAGAVLLAVACGGGFFWLRSYCNPGYERQPFEAKLWQRATHESRGYMAEDLLATRRLVGSPTKDLVGLLGRPDEAYRYSDGRRYRYRLGRLGRNPNCPLTDLSLIVLINDRDVVTSAYMAD